MTGEAVGPAGPGDDGTVAQLLRENLLTLQEVADRAKVSLDTVTGWVRSGLLLTVRLPSGRGLQASASTRARVQSFRRGRQLVRVRETDWVRFVRQYITGRQR